MIKVKVLFFAQLRDVFGKDQETLEIEEGRTVREVVTLLKGRVEWGSVASLPLTFAVNEQVVSDDHTLSDGERLALLTPVSGG